MPEDKLAGDLGNVIEATSIGGCRSDFFTARKLAPGSLGLLQHRHERPRAAAAQVAGRATQNRDCAPAQVVAATSTPTALTCNAGMRSWASAKDCGRMSAPAEATLRFASLREGPQVLAFYRVRSGFHCPDAPSVRTCCRLRTISPVDPSHKVGVGPPSGNIPVNGFVRADDGDRGQGISARRRAHGRRRCRSADLGSNVAQCRTRPIFFPGTLYSPS